MTTAEWPKSRGLGKCCDKERKHINTQRKVTKSRTGTGQCARLAAKSKEAKWCEENIVVMLIKLYWVLRSLGFWLDRCREERNQFSPTLPYYTCSLSIKGFSRTDMLGFWGETFWMDTWGLTHKPGLGEQDVTVCYGRYFQVGDLSPTSNITLD